MIEITRKTLVLAFVFGALLGALGMIASETVGEPSDIQMARDFYRTENALAVSPHDIRTKLEQGSVDFTLVDLRSAAEYEELHIVGAINIPAFSPDDASPEAAEERIVSAFRALPDNREVIMYCYSSACMLSRKVGGMLAEHGITAKHLNIGWIEWSREWELWNTLESLQGVNTNDYVVSGSEPGSFRGAPTNGSACAPGEGGLGC